MDLASLATAASSFSTSIGLAKAALEVRDFNATGAAISEMTQKLLDLQAQLLAVNASFFQLQEERASLAQQVRELKEQRAERESYVLFQLSPGVFVYRFNVAPQEAGPSDPGTPQPLHFLCQRCFNKGTKSVLQFWGGYGHCQECRASFRDGTRFG